MVAERKLSKSQLEGHNLCRRKWGWRKIAKIKGSNRFARLGTLVHEQLEAYLVSGKQPDPELEQGRIAEAGLHLLPTHKDPGLIVESHVFTITDEAWYEGFADWVEHPDSHEGIPLIGDHKSTGNFKWALSEEDLKRDVQANIYARAAMQMYDTEESLAKWVYYRTKGKPRARPVCVEFRRQEVEDFFGEVIDPMAAKVHADYREADDRIADGQTRVQAVLAMEANVGACSMYGGCPYRENCNLDGKQRFKALMAKQSLLASMKAKAKAAKAKQKEEAETETEELEDAAVATAQINPPEAANAESLKEKMKRMASKAKAKPGKAPSPPSKDEPAPKPAPKPRAKKKAKKVKSEDLYVVGDRNQVLASLAGIVSDDSVAVEMRLKAAEVYLVHS